MVVVENISGVLLTPYSSLGDAPHLLGRREEGVTSICEEVGPWGDPMACLRALREFSGPAGTQTHVF